MTREELIKYFEYFSNADPDCHGLERFLSVNGKQEVFDRFKDRDKLNLTLTEFNILLSHSGLTSVSLDFFVFYWLILPQLHTYNLTELELGRTEIKKEPITIDGRQEFQEREYLKNEGGYVKDEIEKYFLNSDGTRKVNTEITTVEHFRWGLLRIYTDALLYFGNITHGFSVLSKKSESELNAFFEDKSFNTNFDKKEKLEFKPIERNDRFLISEAVCKNLDAADATQTALHQRLLENYREAKHLGLTKVKVGVLLDKDAKLKKYKDVGSVKLEKENKSIKMSIEDDITTSEFYDVYITKDEDIDEIIVPLFKRFQIARKEALGNTRIYLSNLTKIDIYVATSMRGKDDFLKMTDSCNEIFYSSDADIKEMRLNFFDPTISAAEGHDDKGLIECLMVKCAKALVYTSGETDSYGKDAEAAMALSSGKPVIFYCPNLSRNQMAKNIHPLTRLIDFETGVANGAMVAENIAEVRTLLKRIFNNKMQYMLTNKIEPVENLNTGEVVIKSYFKLKDTNTVSSVRVQTSDLFLSERFWDHYDNHINKK